MNFKEALVALIANDPHRTYFVADRAEYFSPNSGGPLIKSLGVVSVIPGADGNAVQIIELETLDACVRTAIESINKQNQQNLQ